MLTDKQKGEMQQLLANIKESLPGYRSRASQRRMIAEVANALARVRDFPDPDSKEEMPQNNGESIVAVEGPTGTGKSLAYLLAAGYMAREKKKKLVVSSATIALQEQLVNRDIPFFIEHAGLPLTYTLAKGRGRYVCEYKLRQLTGETAQAEMFEGFSASAAWDRKPETWEITLLRDLGQQLRSGAWSGDIDTLASRPSDELWGRINNDRHTCLNRSCPHFAGCPYFKARAEFQKVDLIVANHDLVLADLGLGGGKILTPPEETFYVLDEGHHIAHKAIESFSSQYLAEYGANLMERLAAKALDIARVLPAKDAALVQIHEQAGALAESLRQVHAWLEGIEMLKPGSPYDQPTLHFADNRLPEALAGFAQNLLKIGPALHTNTEAIRNTLTEERDKDPAQTPVIDQLTADLGLYLGRLETINSTWSLLIQVPAEDEPPIAKWVTTQQYSNGRRHDFLVCASPVTAASSLANLLWRKAAGAVITSATLTSLGNFNQLLDDTGLRYLPETSCVALPSPFNHAEQGELHIPQMRSTPKMAEAHTDEVAELLPQLVAREGGHGTLVLFSSRKQMKDVAERLPADMRRYTGLQGEQGKEDLLKAHYARIDAGQPAILFGLASFAEGLDLPGAYCEHVIIAKLPFAVPDDPVQKTLSAWVESRGGNPFMQITVPQACLRLIQAVGRLIRTETDKGRVTILDTRVLTTRYGRLILKSLPPFRVFAYGKEQAA